MRLTAALSCLCGWWLSHPVAVIAIGDASAAAADGTCSLAGWPSSALLASASPSQSTDTATTTTNDAPHVQLLIGVKTSVLHGAAARRAIRDTWANRSALPANVRVVFLGCAPDLSPYNATEATRRRDAIAAERDRYDGDLLVHELASCRDAYDDLVNKVLAFFQWSATTNHRHQIRQAAKTYLMVADDDIYLRVASLLTLLEDPATPATGFYGGQVWAVQHRRAMFPQRQPPTAQYFLSYDHYAMDQLPPFANGPHYVVSTDVAHFIGRHRAFFRGVGGDPSAHDSVGTFDDVSVALWMLAMQIHPTHIQGLQNMRDTMCDNGFVSYADVSPHAIYQMHHHLQQKRPACLGFSFTTWIKSHPTSRLARYQRDKAQHMAAWRTLATGFQTVRLTHEYDVTVSVEVFTREDERETSLEFVPATNSYWTFCEMLTAHVARELGVLAGQYVFVCEQIRSTLLGQIEEKMDTMRGSRHIFALLLHNLRPMVPVPLLKVAVAANTRYAVIVMENLLTQAYEGMELQIYDEATYATAERDPDIVIFTTGDATSDAAARDRIEAFTTKYTSRLVLLHPRELPLHEPPLDERVLVMTSSYLGPTSPITRHLYLPTASTAFGSSGYHSPVDLLQPFGATSPRSAPFRLRQFCVDDYAPHECDHPHRAYFFNLLNALDHVDVAGVCVRHRDAPRQPHQPPPPLRNDSLAESITTESTFYLRLKTDRYEQFKFTIAFEDTANLPGHVGDTIVAAFLAGSIPIYYGHSPTVAQLFNPRAFIDCGTFASLRLCAKHVLVVHSSPSLSEGMRREAPVVNVTAFYEAFSWHPDVATMVQQARATRNTSSSQDTRTLAERFKAMIDSAP